MIDIKIMPSKKIIYKFQDKCCKCGATIADRCVVNKELHKEWCQDCFFMDETLWGKPEKY